MCLWNRLPCHRETEAPEKGTNRHYSQELQLKSQLAVGVNCQAYVRKPVGDATYTKNNHLCEASLKLQVHEQKILGTRSFEILL